MPFYSQHIQTENDTIIDTTNENDVVQFIDDFFVEHALSSEASRMRIVKLIAILPDNITTKRDITSWVRKNWDKKTLNI